MIDIYRMKMRKGPRPFNQILNAWEIDFIYEQADQKFIKFIRRVRKDHHRFKKR